MRAYVAGALKRVAAMTGVCRAPPRVIALRLAKCGGCPELGKQRKCGICGCPVDLKVLVASEMCPKREWAAIVIASKTCAILKWALRLIGEIPEQSRSACGGNKTGKRQIQIGRVKVVELV